MDKLPKEMFIVVAGFLGAKDLCALCLASSEMLNLIRPVLYQFLIWPTHRNTSDTAQLLISNPDLAKSVRKFLLPPGLSSREHRDVMDLLQKLTFLNEIILEDLPFKDAGEQQKFVDWVTARKLPLKDLSIEPGCYFFSKDFAIPGLTGLLWNQPSLYRHQQLWSALNASRETLQIIVVLSSLEDVIDKFWTLDLPSLKYLVLYQWNSTELGLPKVQNWCLRHQAHLEQIVFLNEGTDEECGLVFTTHGSDGQISLGIRSLIGTPHHLRRMADLHLNFLKPSLQAIIINPSLVEYDSTYSFLDEALTQLLAQATPEHSLFPLLKEITITECPLHPPEEWYPQALDHHLN